MEPEKEKITQLLLSKGIRPSPQRLHVMEYMTHLVGHPTAEEIHSALHEDMPSLSLATVYNTLHVFTDAGLLRVVSVDNTEQRYDLTTEDHGHFKCLRCGAIINFPVDYARIPTTTLAGFEISQKNVYYSGTCPDCIENNRTKEM